MRWLFAHPLPIDHAKVVEAIARAERNTSGEIRVLVARHRTADAVAAARRHFDRLGMARTRSRNAVLIFLAPRSRSFAVIGDRGVHEKCGDAFWSELASAMAAHFKRGKFTEGLEHGVERAGALLAEHFPPEPGARGEPPTDVKEVD
jgi:uncharacterized membrane protein